MGDLAIVEQDAVEYIERAQSRFEQKWTHTLYAQDPIFLFSSHRVEPGILEHKISSVAWHCGIQSPVFVSHTLYYKHIMNGLQNPVKNVETLCHAFLYAVDCDTQDRCILEFVVPGNNSPAYKATAYLRRHLNNSIYIESTT